MPFFADLSVIKTYFTDKPAFPSDLSVNFWPLWWWFTDKSRFLDHLSVKPGPKRLNFYGQTAIFDQFVRNRHFSSSPFTDKVSIFIDVSVNDSDFDKFSAAHHLLNHCTWPRLRAKRCFLKFARNLRPHCFGEGNRVEHFSDFWRFCSTFEVARTDFGVGGRQKKRHSPRFLSTFRTAPPVFGESGRQKRGIYPGFCLLSGPRDLISESPVDKKEAFTPVFVYFQDCAPVFKVSGRQKWDVFPVFVDCPSRFKEGYGQNVDF